jgi:hypothetical protein
MVNNQSNKRRQKPRDKRGFSPGQSLCDPTNIVINATDIFSRPPFKKDLINPLPVYGRQARH